MPTIGENIARRRVFWAVVVLVVGPAILLLLYGLAGLKDRADAVEGRLHERYALQAREIEGAVLTRLAEEDARLRATLLPLYGTALSEAIARYGNGGGVITEVWPIVSPELPPEALESSKRLTAASPITVIAGAAGGADLAISRVRDGITVAYPIGVDVVDAVVLPAIVGQLFPQESARYQLNAVAAGPADAVSFDALRDQLATRLLEDEPFVSRSFGAPFSHWRVEVAQPPEDENTPATRLRYTLVALFLLTVVGVVLMGRAIVQQTRLSRLQVDFVSNVSHELRTPLTSIRMFVETLQSGRVTDPERVQECLAVISAETERLSRKIERVLTWARMEEGRRIYELAPVKPVEAAHRAVEAFRAQTLDRSVALTVEVPDHLPAVLADRDAIVEVLLNLLGNARKYGGAGVEVKLVARSESNGVRFSVEDTGPGIPLLEQRRVFEKFYRADGLLSRRTEGSGLGLAIVAGIVSAHRGKVDLESVEGAGSRFSVWLPLAPL